MSKAIRKVFMERRGSYVFGIVLALLGLLAIIGSLATSYLDSIGFWGYPKDFFAALSQDLDLKPIGLQVRGLRLLYFPIAGVIILALGGGLLSLKRRVIPLVEEVTVTLECPRPSCGNRWEESMAKVSFEQMGYPSVRSLARRRCAKCGKFIRPRIIAVKGFEGEKR